MTTILKVSSGLDHNSFVKLSQLIDKLSPSQRKEYYRWLGFVFEYVNYNEVGKGVLDNLPFMNVNGTAARKKLESNPYLASGMFFEIMSAYQNYLVQNRVDYFKGTPVELVENDPMTPSMIVKSYSVPSAVDSKSVAVVYSIFDTIEKSKNSYSPAVPFDRSELFHKTICFDYFMKLNIFIKTSLIAILKRMS